MKVATILLLGSLTLGASTLPSAKRKNGSLIQDALAPVQVSLQESSAVFYDNEKRENFIYGTVMSADGLLLTKASEIAEVDDFLVRVGKKKYLTSKFLARDDVWDVALLKIEANSLHPVDLGSDSEVELGTWVVSNGASERYFRRPRPGITSAKKREIKGGSPAVLGIQFKSGDGQIEVMGVVDDSGADQAGLEKGDLLLEVDDRTIGDEASLLEYLRVKAPEDKIVLKVKRGDDELRLEVELMARHKLFEGPQDRNEGMSGDISGRRTSFPMILQHDTMLSADSVGGPLFTLDGKFLGMNIAAANRVESFAIPVEELRKVYEKLKASVGLE